MINVYTVGYYQFEDKSTTHDFQAEMFSNNQVQTHLGMNNSVRIVDGEKSGLGY